MNKGSEGKFGTLKRWVIGISGIGVAIASVIFSKQGVGITGELAWIGTVVAIALFCAELMFNSNFDELNWTIIALGIGAYIYSIWTNIQGFYFYRGIEGNLFTKFDITSFFGGCFMDIYPELAVAWAMGASKVGDLLGNLVKTSKDPDKLTQLASPISGQPKPQYQQTSAKFQNIPRSGGAAPKHSGVPAGFRPAPKPIQDSDRPEPTYHHFEA
jgi:hypothetical protein